MTDILYNTALQYKDMLNKGYHIVLGRKCREYHIQLRFKKQDFFHLSGLQHLTDITFPSKNKERVYKEILNRKITCEMISKSIFYKRYFIEERLRYLKRLEEMLDSSQFLFLINHREYKKYTKICADYLCQYFLPDGEQECLYFFIVKHICSQLENECAGCSFFKKHEIDYTRGTSETKLLLNEKIVDFENGKTIKELYRHPQFLQTSY